MPTIVTPSQADTVLEVNRANAIKQAVSKVKAKKPLTKAEVELLQSIAYSSEQGGDPSVLPQKNSHRKVDASKLCCPPEFRTQS